MYGKWKMKNKLAIFDMDGTLFDTKDVNYRAYKFAIEQCGFSINIDYKYYCDYCNGNNYKVFLPKIIPQITQSQMEQIHNCKKNKYASCLKYARKNEILFAMIESLKNEFIIALVTTASKKNVADILKAFEVNEYFDLIVTQEDVQKTKPDPEGYLLALEKSKVTKQNAIIFEDSEMGMLAAKASGIDYVQVYGYN